MIYALNTKNDEHEAAIQTLKEAHEEEVQQILSETREKIMHYKSKITDEMDLKRRIQSLEESMELHERMKRQVWPPHRCRVTHDGMGVQVIVT